MDSSAPEKLEENPIEKIASAVYSPFAMLAGMQLDLFTALEPRVNQTAYAYREGDQNLG